MVALAGELGRGRGVGQRGALAHAGLAAGAAGGRARATAFFVGNMIPTCVCDDRAAGAAVMRRVLRGYVQLPNYQQYWIEAGYEDEMHAIQRPSPTTQDGSTSCR